VTGSTFAFSMVQPAIFLGFPDADHVIVNFRGKHLLPDAGSSGARCGSAAKGGAAVGKGAPAPHGPSFTRLKTEYPSRAEA